MTRGGPQGRAAVRGSPPVLFSGSCHISFAYLLLMTTVPAGCRYARGIERLGERAAMPGWRRVSGHGRLRPREGSPGKDADAQSTGTFLGASQRRSGAPGSWPATVNPRVL